MEAVRTVGLIFGVLLVGATYMSVVQRLIVPRDASTFIARWLSIVLRTAFRGVARGRSYPVQDKILAGSRDIARASGIPFDPDPMPTAEINLSRADFDRGMARLRETGFAVEVSDDEAWAHFRGWRVNYEGIAYAMADRVDAVRAPWSGPRTLIVGEEIEPFRPADRRPDDPEATRDDARPNDPRGV